MSWRDDVLVGLGSVLIGGGLLAAAHFDALRRERLEQESRDALEARGVCHGRGGVVIEDGGCGFLREEAK